jgi:hypothetical protein
MAGASSWALASLAVALASLAACTGEAGTAASATAESESESASASASAPASPPIAATAPAFAAASATPSSERVALIVDGQPVYESEFRFWLRFIMRYYRQSTGQSSISNWNAQQNGLPLREFFLKSASDYAAKDRAVESLCRELGVQLSAVDQSAMSLAREKELRVYGSESEYRRVVSTMYMSEAVFQYLSRMDYLATHLFDRLYGADGAGCDDACVASYVQKEGMHAARYLFIGKLGTDSKPRSAAQVRALRARLAEYRQQLTASKNPSEALLKLIAEYGEDIELNALPDGRLIAAQGKGAVFDAAIAALGENQISQTVETDDGYYLIQRLAIRPTMVADTTGKTLRYWAAYQSLFKPKIEARAATLTIERREAYAAIDLAAFAAE